MRPEFIEKIDVDHPLLKPEDKDYLRALGFESSNGSPDLGKAKRMAKSITDPSKLVRRSKAVVGIWGTREVFDKDLNVINVWSPFEEALTNMGFTRAQIVEISNFTIDESDL